MCVLSYNRCLSSVIVNVLDLAMKSFLRLLVLVVQFLGHAQFFCSPIDCSMLDSSVLYCLPEFAQIHVH